MTGMGALDSLVWERGSLVPYLRDRSLCPPMGWKQGNQSHSFNCRKPMDIQTALRVGESHGAEQSRRDPLKGCHRATPPGAGNRTAG